MKEYNKLSHEEKKELAQLRKDRDSRNKENEGNDQTISALKQQVEDLEARLVAAINTQDEKPGRRRMTLLRTPLLSITE